MPIPIPAFDMTFEEFAARYLREHPGATENRVRMEFANAQAGPELAAAIHAANERQLAATDLISNLQKAHELIGAALGFLHNTKP